MKDSFDLTLACLGHVGEQAEFDGLGVVMAVYQEGIKLAEFSKSAGKDQQSVRRLFFLDGDGGQST